VTLRYGTCTIVAGLYSSENCDIKGFLDPALSDLCLNSLVNPPQTSTYNDRTANCPSNYHLLNDTDITNLQGLLPEGDYWSGTLLRHIDSNGASTNVAFNFSTVATCVYIAN
jgi:hypothetical protein